RQLGLRASHMDCEINRERPALFLVCSDFENAYLRRSLGERVREDRCSALFACLAGDSVRVGPFVASSPQHKFSTRHLTRSWDFSRRDPRVVLVHTGDWVTRAADIRATRLAQNGATLVVGELAKLLFGAQESPLVGRVAENDAPTDFGGWEWLPEVGGAGSFVATAGGKLVGVDDTWREVCRVPVRTWHPLGVG
ncbi:MAG TPA: hypothetical protein VGO53_00980, partial [Steroidobacteraceae bacterium]|nr:hypothetical protein [Steroidobacteraceae bacterium]